MKTWSITQAKRHFSELVKAAESGEPQLITRRGVPVVAVIKYIDYAETAEGSTEHDDPRFSGITYLVGNFGIPVPTIRRTAIRVQTVVFVYKYQGKTIEEIANDYDISEGVVIEALGFYNFHREEINTLMRLDRVMEERFEKIEITPEFSSQVDEFIDEYRQVLEALRKQSRPKRKSADSG